MRPHKIFNETYNANILFFQCETHEELRKYLCKKYDTATEEDQSCAGYSCEIENKKGASLFVLWVKPNKKKSKYFGSLVHECQHVTNFILSNRGVEIDIKKDHEAQAYFIGWLAEKCYQKIK